MKVKVYLAGEEDVIGLLRQADANSFEETGSHDDSRIVVGVNVSARPVRREDWTWTSGNGFEGEKKISDPGEFPQAEKIWSGWILETRAHYGSSSRSRSVLRVFARVERFPGVTPGGPFLVFDMGELGEKDSSSAPFRSSSILEVIASGKKRLQVEISEDFQELLARDIEDLILEFVGFVEEYGRLGKKFFVRRTPPPLDLLKQTRLGIFLAQLGIE